MTYRYWLFASDQYYPTGGLGDLRAVGNDLEKLKAYAEGIRCNEWHVLDAVGGFRITWNGDLVTVAPAVLAGYVEVV